jgi:hypothetical protein
LSTRDEKPKPADLFQLLTSAWIPDALCLVARLGIADELAETARTADDLAERVGITGSPARLFRLLRALTTAGVFRLVNGTHFELTPLGQFLRRNIPGSMRAAAMAFHASWRQAAWGQLESAVRGAPSGFEREFDVGLFDYLGSHKEEARAFYDGQSDVVALTDDAILKCYDFSRCSRIVDVAGGQGSLLCRILAAYPRLHGVVFDLPYAIQEARARDLATAAGVANRVSYVSGDVFESLPAGADLYLIQRFIHGWEDEPATAILANCRAAIQPAGRLVLVEALVAPDQPRSLGAFFDLEMMVVAGGKARTEDEFRVMFEAIGFHLTNIVDTGTPFSIIEAVAVEKSPI